MPMMAVFRDLKSSKASRKPQDSVVQPGVSSLG